VEVDLAVRSLGVAYKPGGISLASNADGYRLPKFHSRAVALLIFVLVSNVSSLGTAFGYYTRDTSGFNHDIFLKKGEIHDVGLVMLTSHHVMLYTKQKTVIVIPSDDVVRLEAKKAN
jgi:hypothetical protein